MVSELRLASKTPPLVVDAGNLLFKKDDPADNPVALITAHGIARVYSKMSYDAVAVSPQDLKAGYDFFKTTQKIGIPWISANIWGSDDQLLFPPAVVIKNLGAPSVGIIGLTGKSENGSSWARINDWREALPEHIAQLESTCGLLVLLSNYSDDENSEIANRYPQIDIIITSSPTRYGNLAPVIVGNSLLTQSDGRGKYLGKLELKWQPQGSWLPAIAEQDGAPANTFDSTFLPVKPLSSGNEVDTMVQDIRKSIAAYQKNNKQEAQRDQKTNAELQHSLYAGVDSCKSCHEKQSSFWAATAHAKAFKSLVRTGQNYNRECLPCHVTGGNITPVSSYTKKDLLLVLPENRQSVGCEVCHGPSRQHTLNPERTKPPQKQPTEKICIKCHTQEHDDDFDFPTKMTMAACPLNG